MNGTITNIDCNRRTLIVESLRLPQTQEQDGALLKRILMKENMAHISTDVIEKASMFFDSPNFLYLYLNNLIFRP